MTTDITVSVPDAGNVVEAYRLDRYDNPFCCEFSSIFSCRSLSFG